MEWTTGRGQHEPVVVTRGKVVLSDRSSYNMCMDKDITYEQFESFIQTFYLQSLKELKEMDEEDMDERCCDNEREGLEINTLENVMDNVNMIIENIDKSKIDKIFC